MPRSGGSPSCARSRAALLSRADCRPTDVSRSRAFPPNGTRRLPLRWRTWRDGFRFRPLLRSYSPFVAAARPAPQMLAARRGPASPARCRGPDAPEDDRPTTSVAALAANHQNERYKQCSPLGLLVIFFGLLSASFVLWTGFKLGQELLHRIKPLHTRQPTALQLVELAFICCYHQHVGISLSLPDVEAKRHLKKAFDVYPFPGSQADDPPRVLVSCVCHR